MGCQTLMTTLETGKVFMHQTAQRISPELKKSLSFTLLEMAVALALIVLLTSASVPTAVKILREESLLQPAREIQMLFRKARQLSIEQRKPVTVRLVLENQRTTFSILLGIGISPSADFNGTIKSYTLPRGLSLYHQSWDDPVWKQVRITDWVFQPTGLMEAPRFRLERKNDFLEFEFHPLTGSVVEQKLMFP